MIKSTSLFHFCWKTRTCGAATCGTVITIARLPAHLRSSKTLRVLSGMSRKRPGVIGILVSNNQQLLGCSHLIGPTKLWSDQYGGSMREGLHFVFSFKCIIWFRIVVMAISTQPNINNWTYVQSNQSLFLFFFFGILNPCSLGYLRI